MREGGKIIAESSEIKLKTGHAGYKFEERG